MMFSDSDAFVNSIRRLSDSQRLEFVHWADFIGVDVPSHQPSKAEREAAIAFRLSGDGTVSPDVSERLRYGSPVFDMWFEQLWLEAEIAISGMVWALDAHDQSAQTQFRDGYAWIAQAVPGQPG